MKMGRVLAVWVIAGVCAAGLRAQSGAVNGGPGQAAAAEAEDPAVTALARSLYTQMRAGKVDPTLLDATMAKGLTPEMLAGQKPVFDQLGDIVKLTLESTAKIVAGQLYTYKAEFASAELHIRMVLNPEGKVAGYRLAP